MAIAYFPLDRSNFHAASLDRFIRHQEVHTWWRRIDGQLQQIAYDYTEDWDIGERRGIAAEICSAVDRHCPAYGAFRGTEVVGFCQLGDRRFGSQGQYIDLHLLHVSEPFRHAGIGRQLFHLACESARQLGASKLYLSAHSSRESQIFYRNVGCIEAVEPNPALVALEPCDVQMEYAL